MNTIEGMLHDIKILRSEVDRLLLHENLAAIPWTDYAGISTIVGWSSFLTKAISYAVIGKLVFVTYQFAGTSNATTSTFTLPYTSGAGMTTFSVNRAKDNSGAFVPGLASINNASGTVNLYPNIISGAWTNSGTKATDGEFWYIRV